jgi:hypothetical protein
MELETDPSQPAQVVQALAEALEEAPRPPDPWWRAGIEENLGT